jgi:hypothetical protein
MRRTIIVLSCLIKVKSLEWIKMSKPRVRKSLLLAAFFTEDGVRQFLATRGVHTPAEVEQLVGSWRTAREVLEQTPPWAGTEQVEVTDPPAELSAMIADLSKSEALRATVQNLPHRIAFVSLGQLVAFQFTVDKPYSAVFKLSAGASVTDVAQITLPAAGPRFPLQVGADGSGLTISAPGPNLRIAGMQFQASDSGPIRLTVDLTFGSPYVQVAEFQGRLIVRNGYHRLVGLLSQGVTHAPVILLHCTDYAETGGVGPSFFPSQVVMGVKPPLLKHYLTPYAVEFDAADVHKTIRLRPDEFQVAVPE